MVQEAARQALLRDGKVLTMKDFNEKEIDWEYLDLHGPRESWRHKFLICAQMNCCLMSL